MLGGGGALHWRDVRQHRGCPTLTALRPYLLPVLTALLPHGPADRLHSPSGCLTRCANIVLMASPERIVLSGGVMLRESLFPKIRRAVQAQLNGYIQLGQLTS